MKVYKLKLGQTRWFNVLCENKSQEIRLNRLANRLKNSSQFEMVEIKFLNSVSTIKNTESILYNEILTLNN
jgi:hypothetical protein